ncbi:MAG: sugar nucleotide-binding protein [Trueperaceae bacterium]|nr:sugar nucleotide-binding protein [Trueperaceae bacterium]
MGTPPTPHVLMTGATGTLGRALVPRLTAAGLRVTGTASADADVRDADAVRRLVAAHAPDVVLHAAAFTDVAAAETDRATAWAVNVAGTRHVADAAREGGARLLHVSSDYVFWGGDDRPEGGYRETDPPGPVRNAYALTKLVAEEAARRAPDALLLRTSFRPSVWPHPTAFTDLFTGQDYVDVIADLLTDVVRHHDEVEGDVLHVVTERKSVFDLVRRRTPDVAPGVRADAPVALPADVSLNTDRLAAHRGRWRAAEPAA